MNLLNNAALGCGLPTLGLFSWDIGENRLIADDVFAQIYGFEPARLVRGVAIEDVLARILETDREQAAHLTRDALLSGKFSIVTFRIYPDRVTKVLSFGRCLRDEEGLPTIFTGGLFEQRPNGAPFLSLIKGGMDD